MVNDDDASSAAEMQLGVCLSDWMSAEEENESTKGPIKERLFPANEKAHSMIFFFVSKTVIIIQHKKVFTIKHVWSKFEAF